MKLKFTPENKEANLTLGDSILEHAEISSVSLNHSCGGNCCCSTCHVYIIKGMEHLSKQEEDEISLLETASGFKKNSRLACQTRILQEGAIEVEVPE